MGADPLSIITVVSAVAATGIGFISALQSNAAAEDAAKREANYQASLLAEEKATEAEEKESRKTRSSEMSHMHNPC